MVVDFEERIPPGFVIVDRAAWDERLVLAELPGEDGLLWTVRRKPPRGWVLLPDSFDARRLAFLAFYPIAWRLVLVLARLARIERPCGETLRGYLQKMGAAVERERRAGRIAE